MNNTKNHITGIALGIALICSMAAGSYYFMDDGVVLDAEDFTHIFINLDLQPLFDGCDN